jgi:hypothetical protein
MKDFTRKTSDLVPKATSQSPDSSFDTDSTESTSNSSTEADHSFGRVSFCEKLDDEDIESPCSIRQRGTRLLQLFDEAWSETLTTKSHRSYERRNSKESKILRRSLRQSQKIGLLVGVIMIVAFLARPVIQQRLEFQQWKNAFEKEAKSVMKEIRKSHSGAAFTVVLRGRRLDLLKRAVDAHSQCSEVSEIQVEYQGNGEAFPQYLHRYGGGKVTHVGPISTTAAFFADEGVIFSCEDLQNAFNIWKRDPWRLVSFPTDDSSRMVMPYVSSTSRMGEVMPRHESSFVHRRYLEFSTPTLMPLVCSERLLSVLVSTMSQKAPILVKATPQQIIRQPLQAGPTNGPAEEDAIRDQCLHHLERLEAMQRSSSISLEATTVLGSR